MVNVDNKKKQRVSAALHTFRGDFVFVFKMKLFDNQPNHIIINFSIIFMITLKKLIKFKLFGKIVTKRRMY